MDSCFTKAEGGSQTISGISFVSITGGTFQMGDVENAGDWFEMPHSVTVSDFEMGVYEITNSQYAQYLNDAKASGDITPSSSIVTGAKGDFNGQKYIYFTGIYDSREIRCGITYSNGSFTVEAGKENWPVVYVTWYGSKAFALYYGLDLPTETEWEYACRGGKQHKYGTDDGTISTSNVNYWDNVFHPVAVGSYAKNPYGLCDMSGNVWEWCLDWYGSYSQHSQNNPTGILKGTLRVMRGGSWNDTDYSCRSARRHGSTQDGASTGIGFRVVRRASTQSSTFNLQGKVLENGSSLSGISVQISGGETVTTDTYGNYSFTMCFYGGTHIPRVTTDSNGNYSFTDIGNGSYTITPSKTGYTFTPASVQVIVNGANTAVPKIAAIKSSTGGTTEIQGVMMASIPAGTFQMERVYVCEPVYTGTLSAFEMSVYAITNRQYKSVNGSSKSEGDDGLGDNYPVINVDWWHAIKYCNALSVKAGYQLCYNESTGDCDFSKDGFRLPTEAEWEYACRAGSTTHYNLGDATSDLDRAGWYDDDDNSCVRSQPVGQKTPNAWGLYDMHGNVWEWCNDRHRDYSSWSQSNPLSLRVLRGGSWSCSHGYCRSTGRIIDYSINSRPSNSDRGFRVVRRAYP